MKLKSIFKVGALVCSLSLANAQVTNEGSPKSWEKNSAPIAAVKLPAFDLNTLVAEDAVNDLRKDLPYRFGKKFDVNYNINNSGKWETLENGDRIWRMRFTSEGAKSMNFILEDFFIPVGGSIYVYNQDHSDLLGAYTFTQNNKAKTLGTWIVKGDDVTIEYFEPASQSGKGSFSIKNITHGYRIVDETKDLNTSGNCNIDVNCPIGDDADPLKDIQKKAVAMILVGGSGWCSGALVNNTANDGKPYFLTANHCYTNPASWAFRFNWISTNTVCATTENSVSNSDYKTISGATLKARRSESDFCLVELTSEIPNTWDVVWSGWDRSTAVSPYVFGIHHPDGDIMKTCRDSNPVSTDYASTGKVWRINDWEMGVTEGGSSGSPLYNNQGHIIGQLWRGSAACSGTNDNGGYDEYGRLNVSWDAGGTASTQLKDWLDPTNSGVTVLDSYPPVEVHPYDASIGIIGLTPQICENTITPSVVIKNNGSEILTSATVTYQLNNENPATLNWTGSLNQYETQEIALTAINITENTNTFKATVSNPNGETDGNENNNTSSYSFTKTETYSGNTVVLTIKPDNYGSETTWNVKDANGNIVTSGGPYTNNNTNLITQNIALTPNACYTFTINDSYGDGICCSFGNGYYNLKLENGTTIIEGASFGSFESKAFKLEETMAVNDASLDQAVQVFPNPSKGIFNISVADSLKGNVEYELYSTPGSLIKKGALKSKTNTIDLSGKPSGVYLLKVSNGTQTAKTIKLIKQ